MKTKKRLYRVQSTYDVVVVAEDDLSACKVLRTELHAGKSTPDPDTESATLVTCATDIPPDWSVEAIPYGGTTDRTIREWLYLDKPVVVRGDAKKVETFLAKMREAADTMSVEVLDAPAEEE